MASASGPGAGSRRAGQRQLQRWYSFGRDVWVNLLANLIAAAVIYLVAKATGYIKGNPAITSIALAVVAGVLAVVVAIWLERIPVGSPFQFVLTTVFYIALLGLAVWLDLRLNPNASDHLLFLILLSGSAGLFAFGYCIRVWYVQGKFSSVSETAILVSTALVVSFMASGGIMLGASAMFKIL